MNLAHLTAILKAENLNIQVMLKTAVNTFGGYPIGILSFSVLLTYDAMK